jgi:hypothetical protein
MIGSGVGMATNILGGQNWGGGGKGISPDTMSNLNAAYGYPTAANPNWSV